LSLPYSGNAADRLAAVQTAIGNVLSGQSYKIGDRELTRANLRELRQMEKELLIENGQQAGGFTLGEMDRIL
jgi:hypothetical protein